MGLAVRASCSIVFGPDNKDTLPLMLMRFFVPIFFIVPLFGMEPLAWPEIRAETKPWTRWWWLGSAVDEKNLTRELEDFAKAGFGGVEICPIYGVKGAEERYLPFLSDSWVGAVTHTMVEAERLGMKVDLTTGTGWPFGGPMVKPERASRSLVRWDKALKGLGKQQLVLPEGELISLVADSGRETVDLKGMVKGGRLDWLVPEGDWRVMGLFSTKAVQQVKRAAPGGEGPVLDPFSTESMEEYLKHFSEAFESGKIGPRAHFHDSFEYYGAAWTPGLVEAFRKQHGYDLLDRVPEWFGARGEDVAARVRSDYRATLSDLHRRYLEVWNAWAKGGVSMTRNQAHGSPGNLLDHYAVSDIPETEIFRHVADDQIPMLQFAASAARTSGRKLTSAESFTWLDEHFQVTPGKLKEAADFLFLGGVNHLFYHGVPYSPEDAGWPGWLFYASTHMGRNGGLWRDLPSFNGYLARCQSILQEGVPSVDALLYFPAADLLHRAPGDLPLFTIHDQHHWLQSLPFYRTAMSLWVEGRTCDFVSDRMLERAKVEGGMVVLGGIRYPALILPSVKMMPVETLERISELLELGAVVIVEGGLPEDVPGFGNLDARRAVFLEVRKRMESGKGRLIHATTGPGEVLDSLGQPREAMGDLGVRFVRRRHDEGYHYFVVNRGDRAFDGVLPIARKFTSAIWLDPNRPVRVGLAKVGSERLGRGVEIRLEAGESMILRTFDTRRVEAPPFPELHSQRHPVRLTGPWELEFVEGGPALPKSVTLDSLGSWTTLADPKTLDFSGTGCYRASFMIDGLEPGREAIDLGQVSGTARIRLNGKEVARSWSAPHRFEITQALRAGENVIEIEVTNLAANRIAALDRANVDWRIFHEINFVNIDYKPFDSSNWLPLSSGLLGPVMRIPLD